jgi:hypothetical protein
MQDQPIPDRPDSGGSSPTEAEDIRYQGVVLIHVLHRHPTLLTTDDLVREITSGAADFEESDAIARLDGPGGRWAAAPPERPRRAVPGGAPLPHDHQRGRGVGGAGGEISAGRGAGHREGPERAPCSGPPESPHPRATAKDQAPRQQPCRPLRRRKSLCPKGRIAFGFLPRPMPRQKPRTGVRLAKFAGAFSPSGGQ